MTGFLARLLYQVQLGRSVAWYPANHSPDTVDFSLFVMEHPLNAYRMIQRFLTDWQLIDELMLNNEALEGQRWPFSTLALVKVFTARSELRISFCFWRSL